jgi:hypothetical protein
MWTLSSAAAQAIRGSYRADFRVTATGPDGSTLTGLPLVGGTINDSAQSQTRRSGTVYIGDTSWWPEDPTDLLSATGAQLFPEWGISVPGLPTEWVPLGRYVITDVDQTIPDAGQGLTVTIADQSQLIKDDRLAAPLQIGTANGTIVQEITALIQRTIPDAEIVDLTGDTTVCPTYTIQQDPWADGVEVLAAAIGAEVFANQIGQFVIRPQPTLDDPVVWQVQTGQRGNLVSNARKKTRSTAYNAVICTAEPSTGVPVTVTVTDDDPASPTYWGGPFGHRPAFYTSALITTQEQATAAATAMLARAKGTDTQVVLGTVPNPALQSGDVVRLLGSTGNRLHIVDTVTFPFGSAAAAQQLTGRTTNLTDLELQGLS